HLSGNDDTHRDGDPHRRDAHDSVAGRDRGVLPAHPAPERPAAAARPRDRRRAVARRYRLHQ
ncbi:hypothetical protein M9458_033980, partial [Cirrhinus mrigala]